MPSTGIEPANLRLLARRSNQLSYAAAAYCIEYTQDCKKKKSSISNFKFKQVCSLSLSI